MLTYKLHHSHICNAWLIINIMNRTSSALCSILLYLMAPTTTSVRAYPTGAPVEACTDIYPTEHARVADSQDLGSNPFQIGLSDLDRSRGDSVYYIPGRTYTLTLSGSGGEQFRGFLVQARSMADDSPVGVFTDNGNDQRISFCTPQVSAVTHPNSDLKSVVTLSWTAPPEESGELHILFAVVFKFNQSTGHSIFWAPATTDVILPCAPPLYRHGDSCVETCPPRHIGNHTSGHCDPFPTGYVLSLNATRFYANLNSETPLNSSVFHIQLSINLQITPQAAINDVAFRFFQNQLVQSLFEFENGLERDKFEATDYIQNIDDETGVINATIILVALPAEEDYPVNIDMTISVSLFSNIVHSNSTKAVGDIVLAPGACESYSCQNGGTCMDTNSTYFTCECPPQFTGQTCEEVLDACQLLGPCINGTCNPVDSTEYTCTCLAGYTGHNCSEHICEQDITCGNGVCTVEENVVGFACNCSSGYTGEFCDKIITECANDNVGCSGNGNCTDLNGDSYCECYPGWTGVECETQTTVPCNPNPCANGGTCSEDSGGAMCMCIPGWTGMTCESQISACDENPCQNNGMCTTDCERCLNGTGQQFNCSCVDGFTGDVCMDDDSAELFCQPDSCANFGTCVEEHGPSVSCLCTLDFTGPTCSEAISGEDSCTQVILDRQILIILICAVAAVLIVAMIGAFITIVLAVHYQAKAKARKHNITGVPNVSNMEMDGRVFSNTNMDRGIYFDSTDVSRQLPPATNTEFFTPSTGPTRHSLSSRSSQTQPLLSSLSLSTSIQQTAGSESEDAVDQPALNETVMNQTAAVASAYELPITRQNNTITDNRVFTLPSRSAIRNSGNNNQQSLNSSPYETVY